ncbi:MAG: type III pantothenate kinase [Oscillospiraceae bacterium]|nr:type III pantothenate kinase [Oscillospiraceae bacterium]
MILTVDIGNTTVALTALERRGDDYEVVFSDKLPSRDPENLYTPVERLLDGRGAFEGAVLSSVVPELTGRVCDAVERVIGSPVTAINSRDCGALRFDVDEPKKIGLDRIADSAWAAYRYPLPAVTVDFGTATTFNVIGEGAVFLGGMIASGIATSVNALAERAAQLPPIELNAPERLIGRNTAECMLSGAVIGAAAMTDGIAARVEAQLGKPVSLILTGGGAELAEPFCLYPHVCEPWLLAKGLAHIYENLSKKL